MRPLEFTRSGLLASVAVFVIAAGCIRLGLWQLDRRTERLERNAAVTERLADVPVPIVATPLDTAGLTHRRATLSGFYDNARTLVLGGRSHAGAPGVHVYAPLRIGEGAVLVNRGWLPSADAATIDLSLVTVDTMVTVAGVLLPLPVTGSAEGADGAFRTTWFRLDAPAVRAQYPYPISPLYLQAAAVDEEAARLAEGGFGVGPVPLPPPSLDAGPHLSYALQWFSFATIALVGWGALVMRRGRGGVTPAAGTSG